ncbi:MAG TPA: hypothetical protein VGG03_23265 [Thermoanaerobaculia bacterium]|jgi:hypothetical protein
MSPNRRLRRAFPALILLTVLVLASLPAQAQPARRPMTGVWKIAVLGEGALARVRVFLAGLWTQGATKEGVSIDPNGAPTHAVDPDGASSDEGTSIDPDGRK